jgi:hypothetical protein
MIEFIITVSILTFFLRIAEKSMKNYDYGRLNLEKVKHNNKESYYFK